MMKKANSATPLSSSIQISDLSSDNLLRCLSNLSLKDFAACSRLSRSWRSVCRIAFGRILMWRCDVKYRHITPPEGPHIPCIPYAGRMRPGIQRGCGTAAFVSKDSGRVVAIMADAANRAVRTFEFAHTGRIVEHPIRKWKYDCVRGFSDSLVGYRYSYGAGRNSMAYFPVLSNASPSHTVRETPADDYQNMLQIGDQVFFIPECGWWTDAQVVVHVMHLPSGRWLRMDVAPFRDELRKLKLDSDEKLPFQAVSATETHFVYRVHYLEGVVIGALFIPDASKGASTLADAPCIDITENGLLARGFVRRYPKEHPIFPSTHGGTCNEACVGEEFLMYKHTRTSGIFLSLVNSFSGSHHAVRLRLPAKPKVESIHDLTICRDPQPHTISGSIAACAATTQTSSPRAVTLILWDLHTGIALTCIHIASVDPKFPITQKVRVQIHKKKDCDPRREIFDQFAILHGIWGLCIPVASLRLMRFGDSTPQDKNN